MPDIGKELEKILSIVIGYLSPSQREADLFDCNLV